MIENNIEVLLVNKDQDSYQVLSKAELNRCPRYEKDVYICQRNHVLYRNFEHHCLSALYKGKFLVAPTKCKLYLFPDHPTAVQLSDMVFYIHHPTEQTVHVTCSEQTHAKRAKGLMKLTLNGCSASCDSYQIKGIRSEQLNDQFLLPAGWNPTDFTQEEADNDDAIRKDILKAIDKMDKFKPSKIPEDSVYDDYVDHSQSVVIIVLIVLVLIILYIMYKVRKQGKQATAAGSTNIEMNLLPPAAVPGGEHQPISSAPNEDA